MTLHIVVLIGLVLVGGLVPLIARDSHRALHFLVSLSAGLFLGVVFLHLLPEVAALEDSFAATGHEGHDHGHAHGDVSLWAWVLAGALGLFLLQNVFLDPGEGDDRSQHLTVSWASLFGLVVHAFTAGLGLGALEGLPRQSASVLASIGAHKFGEAFSLTTVFLLAGFSRRTILFVIAGFALVTPIGLLAGTWLVEHLTQQGVHSLTALAAGTFLFVALCDLLPEVFHGQRDRLLKVVLVLVGIGLSFFVEHGGH